MGVSARWWLATVVFCAALGALPDGAWATDWWVCVAVSDDSQASIVTAGTFASSLDVDQVSDAFRKSLPLPDPARWRSVCTRSDTREQALAARLTAKEFNLQRRYRVGEIDWSPATAAAAP